MLRYALDNAIERIGQIAGVGLKCYCAGDSPHAYHILIAAGVETAARPYPSSVAWFDIMSAVQKCDAQRCPGNAGGGKITKLT
jgi:hypothetical protein